MKSRKLGLFGKRSLIRATRAKLQNRGLLRKGLVEKLEGRELMAADWNAALVNATGVFTSEAARTSVVNYVASRAAGGSGAATIFPEGSSPTSTSTVAEVEPNNSPNRAQPLNDLTNANRVAVTGVNINAADEDWFSFNLNAGDILDVRVDSTALGIPTLSLYNNAQEELATTVGTFTAILPDNSALTGALGTTPSNGSLHYIVSRSGRYLFRLGDAVSAYTLTFSSYRPPIESQTAGTTPTLFLDFNGASVARTNFGFGTGTARITPLANELTAMGLTPAELPTLIDEITQRTRNKFEFIRQNTTNPNFALNIVSSKDVADPWGNPNVTRVIVGGNFSQLTGLNVANPGLLGIAESVDPGNYNAEETAFVLADLIPALGFPPVLGTLPADDIQLAASATRIQFYAEFFATIIAHEAGHTYGGWHTDPTPPVGISFVNSMMDPAADQFVNSGAGRDNIFGNADDEPLQFAADLFAPGGRAAAFQQSGVNDTINWLGWALGTGTVGGRITGNVYHDRNLSRTRDTGDVGLAGFRVYTDLNNNAVLDSGEFSAFTDAAGNYSLLVPAGTYTVRQILPPGFRFTAPASGAVSVTVVGINTVSNINFGQEILSLNGTGVKWNDVNGNGLRDPGEGVISGVRMYLDLDGDGRIDIGEPSAKTDSFGNYSLTFPGPGTYKIREVVEPGFVQTFPNAAANFEHTVVLSGNPAIDQFRVVGLNFGNKLTVDFGDAPATYGEASAGFTAGLLLGANWDDEQTSQFSATATGDDIVGVLNANDVVIDDEDGIIFTRPLVTGNANNRVSVTAVNNTGISAFLNGWIDFNQDGDFADANEKIFSNTIIGSGTSTLTFAAPAGALLGSTFARFRYSNERDVGPTGRSASGEVEDYRVTVVASLDLAVDDNFGVARNSVLNSFNVLANDFSLPGEQLTVVNASGSRAGAVVQIGANNQILYTPPAGFIGQDIFTYTMTNASGESDTATVTVDVNLFFDDPIAVDDSFDVAINAIDSPLNVLANDIEGQSGALTIIGITQPSGGGQITIASGGKSLRYTPLRNFRGTETFTYTVADAGGNRSTARGTLQVLPFVDASTDVVYSVRTTDLNGNEISAIQQGRDFRLEVYVDDFRNDRGAAVVAPGVFAAYMDILYDLQLVATATPGAGSSLNFDAVFFNNYVNFIGGDASIPGIIDEFGAFSNIGTGDNPGDMNFPNEVLLAAITFTARSPGLARFSTNPADISPDNDTLLFNTSGSAVPVGRIRFEGTSIEVIGDSTEFPQAIDDSVATPIPAGTVRFPINVRANDLAGSTGSISVVAVTSGANGSTAIDSSGRVVYTPNAGFTGTDQFEYTIEDTRRIRSRARVTVRVGATTANDIVDLRLDVTDLNGTPITDIAVGGQFQLRGYVRDLRTPTATSGVFAAYQDILYSSSLVRPVASTTNELGFQVAFGPNYPVLTSGSIATSGLINEIGAVQRGANEGATVPLGAAEQLMFIVTMTARAVGTASFVGDPADISPLHDTITFEPAAPVGIDFIRYGSDTLNITATGSLGGGEFTNPTQRHDVNADGYVSPLDALLIIKQLHGGGAGALGEGEGPTKLFVDVNGDKNLSPLDVLLVISYLNKTFGSNSGGEGEGFAPTTTAASATDAALGSTVDDQDDLLAQLAVDIEINKKKRS